MVVVYFKVFGGLRFFDGFLEVFNGFVVGF